MTKEMGGNDTLSVKERFAAMEKHWKKKEDLYQMHIEALLSTTKALHQENSMLCTTMATQTPYHAPIPI